MLKDSIKDILRIPFYKVYDTLFSHDKDFLKRNNLLKNKYQDERCFFLLTGESISYIDLELLRKEYSFGAGFLFFHPQIKCLNLNFYYALEAGGWMDKLGARGSHNWPENYIRSGGINQGKLYLKEVFNKLHDNGTKMFLNHDFINYYKKIKLFNLEDDKIIYLKSMSHLHKENHPVLDLTKRFIAGGGSIHQSILIVIYMGFKEIYLCGAGYTYKPCFEFHFYDSHVFPKSMGKQKAIIEAKKVVAPHNKKKGSTLEYYGLYEKDDLYRGMYVTKRKDELSFMKKHRIIDKFAKSQGVKIFNIVPDGFESPVYEKISWEEVVNNVLPKQPKHT